MKKAPFPALALSLGMMMSAPFGNFASAQEFNSVTESSVLTGWQTDQGTQMAAFYIALGEGWKTYWRAPGDTGIPPRFDWTGSENIAAVQFHWPRPEVHDNAGVQTIGYKDALILPVEITPVDPAKPMRVDVQMQLGVCETVCLPVTLDFAASLDGGGIGRARIREALAQRPRTADEAGIHPVKCSVDPIRDGLTLTAEIRGANLADTDAVVFELSDKEVWISAAELSRNGHILTAQADMVPPSATPFVLDRSDVRITIIGGDHAVNIQGCRG